ncbi:hypothetical protein [Dietzia lutea]|uniref:Uncharacterized protein n=1 Tax=Dietzia lutea TaxID=546160 RepID=A0A2S1R6F9_9ACTN|nr:hypothetical protein [Dietzia lutea]AWH91877.1 hypothetical protein A6035_06565 [Dietzia lutea]
MLASLPDSGHKPSRGAGGAVRHRGSVEGSLTGEGGADTDSAGSIAGLLDSGSIATAVAAAQGSSGSIGDLAGVIDPDGFGEVISGSIESASDDEEGGLTGSLGEIPEGSIAGLFETIGGAGGSAAPAE